MRQSTSGLTSCPPGEKRCPRNGCPGGPGPGLSGLSTCWPAGTSCGASWRWWAARASAQSPTTGPCSSSCCPPASTLLRRAARTPSAPCRRVRDTSATSWTTARSASTAWVSRRRSAERRQRPSVISSSAPFPTPRFTAGSAFPYAAYSMPASWLHSRLHQLFVPTAALNSFLCTGLSCYSRWVLRPVAGGREGTGGGGGWAGTSLTVLEHFTCVSDSMAIHGGRDSQSLRACAVTVPSTWEAGGHFPVSQVRSFPG